MTISEGGEKPNIDASLIDHAARLWDAERENASRLAGRTSFLLTAMAALFGLGIYRIEWFRSSSDVELILPFATIAIIKILLSIGLVAIGISFFWILSSVVPDHKSIGGFLAKIRRFPCELICDVSRACRGIKRETDHALPSGSSVSPVQPPFSSHLLNIPANLFDQDPPEATKARMMVLALLSRAALDLQDRNTRQKKRQNQGQQIFLVGIVFIGAAVLMYISASEPPMIVR